MIFHDGIAIGKFHGAIRPAHADRHAHQSCCKLVVLFGRDGLAEHAIAFASRRTIAVSMASCTSPRVSKIGLPISRVMSKAMLLFALSSKFYEPNGKTILAFCRRRNQSPRLKGFQAPTSRRGPRLPS
jgi:hypothetical protein